MFVSPRMIAMFLAAITGIHHRHHKPKPKPSPAPMQSGVASWYDDSGSTASGRHYTYGFASLMFGSEWGRTVRFCYRGRCTSGQMDDHGPYVSGRQFDLNWSLRNALGCPDICYLQWSG